VSSNFSFSDPEPGKLLHKIDKEVGVRVAVVRPGPVGLEVDVVPGDTVGLARGHGGAHCEEQPLLPRQVEPVQSPESIRVVRKVSRSGEIVSSIRLTWRGVLRSLHPGFEAEVNCDCARTLITRQRALVDSVAHASILRPVACTHTMDLLADRALEEGGGTGLQHLVQTLTVEAMGTEVELPARPPIVVHVPQADCALFHRLHRLPLSCVLTQSVRGWRGVCYRVSLSWWWWITSKHGTAEREVVLKEIVEERIVSSPPNLLWLLTKKSKLLSSEIWNGLLKERLLLDLVACWLSWVPGLEVRRVEADVVLPYVLTQTLKNRVGRKLRVILGEEQGDGDLVARGGQGGPVEGKDGLLSHYPHLVAGHHRRGRYGN